MLKELTFLLDRCDPQLGTRAQYPNCRSGLRRQ